MATASGLLDFCIVDLKLEFAGARRFQKAYAVEAGAYRLLGAQDWRFDRALALMRLVSLVLVAPLPLMAT